MPHTKMDLDSRHLIANCAHDLKTPLASFMSGIELIFSQVNELEDLVSIRLQDQVADGILQNAFKQIRSNLSDIGNTNAFMLLAINRTQDFAKTATGGKLTPAYETVDVREILRMPIHCIQNANHHNCEGITLSELPWDLSSHIITDGHWVQENLLCLLSNATKYSTGGPIEVRITKTPRHHIIVSSLDTSAFSTDTFISTTGAGAAATPTNALQSSMTQQESFCVVNSPRTVDFMLKIEVIDSGIGLSEDNMSHLFNPFQMTQRLAGGTGLGLYSLAKRVEALKGEYGVSKRSDGKQGSVFWFSFPYRPDSTMITSSSSSSSASNSHSNIGLLKTMFKPPPLKIDAQVNSNLPCLAGRATMTPLHVSKKNSNGTPKRLLTSRRSPQAWTVQVPNAAGTAITAAQIQRVFNILLVEDAPPIYKITKALLERRGHHVTHAVNGAIAMEMIQANMQLVDISLQGKRSCLVHHAAKKSLLHSDTIDEEDEGAVVIAVEDDVMEEPITITATVKKGEEVQPFDVILMDLHMPVMDGLEATKRIRELESVDIIHSAYRQRIVGLSANSDQDTLAEATDCGFDAFMDKPFNMNTFEATMMDLLSRPVPPAVTATASAAVVVNVVSPPVLLL